MSLENGKCPNCNGVMALDISKEKINCRFCGAEILIPQAVQKCKVDGIASFDTILLSAQEAVELDQDYDMGLKKYKEALALSPNDYRVLWGIYLCELETIKWYGRTKGYVQFEGDIPSQMESIKTKYANRAIENAPEEVKPYYYRFLQNNGMNNVKVISSNARPEINLIILGVGLLFYVVPGVIYFLYIKSLQKKYDQMNG